MFIAPVGTRRLICTIFFVHWSEGNLFYFILSMNSYSLFLNFLNYFFYGFDWYLETVRCGKTNKQTKKSWSETFVLQLDVPVVLALKNRWLSVWATGGSVCSLCVHSQPARYCLLYTHPIFLPLVLSYILLFFFFYERDYIEEVRQCVRTGYKQIQW